MIPQDFIQTLLNRVDIVDVIDRRVPLKKAGANFQACCPFHNEKSPSFTVSPSKQFYHCFGCGAHGTAIGFLMEYAGLGYVDAIKELASQSGMTVPEGAAPDPQRVQQVASLVELMQRAAQYYRQQLKLAPVAIDYLKKRGLTGEIAARFGLGYAPSGWQNLQAVFDHYDDTALVEGGLVIVNDAGKRYDRFRERIMFPIVGLKGDVIGFGGRVLDSGEPKYLNSPETPLFQKGHELYGLFQARRAIRDAGRALVVEGYMDVVALAQHGVDYAVATLGTATTPNHLQKLLRHTDEVVFCFDGDSAGQRAAWRALENSLAMLTDSCRVGFLFLPAQHDPDSYIREHGKAGFEVLLSQQIVPLSSYLAKELAAQHDLTASEGKSAFLKAAQPLLSQVSAPGLALMLRKRIAELAGIQQNELETLWKIEFQRKRPANTPLRTPRPAPVSNYRRMLRALLFQPALARELNNALLTLTHPDASALQGVIELLQQHPHLETAAVVEHFRNSALMPQLQQASSEIMVWADDFDAAAEFALAREQIDTEQHNLRTANVASKSLSTLTEAEKMELQQLSRRKVRTEK
ncbi:MAG TPA: DNA primase [Betaproteobacteria bacterium]|nr:DNA primase [Betaproteobacteria bacterium]